MSAEEERPFKSEHCDECHCVDWSFALNERGFCCGIPKNPKPKEDVVRFCLIDKAHGDFVDLTVDEALTIASHLSMAASKYIKKLLANKDLL